MPEDEVVFQLEDVEHRYPNGTHALKGINLQIRGGEFIGLIGQNGSGKTTLAKHLNALLRPTNGRILFKSEDTERMPVSKMAASVGYVFQNPDHQIFSNTVYDEIAFGPRNLKLPQAEVDRRVEEALTFMNLAECAHNHPQTLSRGQRQRLAIASVLSLHSPVLILDEPTGGQDRQQARNLMSLLVRLNQEGHTVILITHDLELAAEYCRRLLVLAGGRVLLDGDPDQVFRETEKLASTRLRAPDIYRLTNDLGWETPALSVGAFVEHRSERGSRATGT